MVRLSDRKQNELLTNTALWYGIKCVFLFIMTLHIPTCIWYNLACTGRHKQVVCKCVPDSWAGLTWDGDDPKLMTIYYGMRQQTRPALKNLILFKMFMCVVFKAERR